ncbi:hypothetical protein AAT19DRAFT_12266 [Rhodotorula toruloides]|uniref:N-acetyltransferase domain-containing protein n=1 Tax=Rhodotorula toruloides TaxID=5286 RepID=A0A2T0AFR6_RHOTO|nr:hypothetical protein AAT19DRAFT_12266 [Rhodotorula toruloides]
MRRWSGGTASSPSSSARLSTRTARCLACSECGRSRQANSSSRKTSSPSWMSGESHRFSCLFDRTAKLRSRFARDGTGVWGSEVTDHSEIAYLEHMRIKPEYRGQGIGAWALKELYKASDGIRVAETDFLFVQPGALEEEFPSHDPFAPDPHREAKLAMSDRITRFYQRNGFRRVGTTSYFCLAFDPNHPSHRIPIEQDAKFVEDVTMSQGELVGMLARDQMPW